MGKLKDREVKRFAAKLKRRLRIWRIFFGSRARSEYVKGSDYDFMVVWPDFEEIFFTSRPSLLYPLEKAGKSTGSMLYA